MASKKEDYQKVRSSQSYKSQKTPWKQDVSQSIQLLSKAQVRMHQPPLSKNTYSSNHYLTPQSSYKPKKPFFFQF